MEEIKTSSSCWIKTQARGLRSLSPGELGGVVDDIEGQEARLRSLSIQDEERRFLKS